MKKVWTVLAACIATTAVMVGWQMMKGNGTSAPQPQVTHSRVLTVERIQALSVLTTLKVDVADAQVTELRGHTGSIKAVLLVKGEVAIGVDLAAARFEMVDEAKHSAVLLLPSPRVQSVRLDHQKTKLVGVWPAGLWEIVPGGEDADTAAINLAYRDAERAVSATAQDGELMERAKRQAASVLRAFCAALGWEVEVRPGD